MEHHDAADAGFEAEDALFRIMVQQTKEYAIFALTPDGIIATWNEGGERLMQYAPAEIRGRHGAVIFTPEDRAAGAPEQEITTAAETGEAADDRWHVRKDGSRFWASGMLTALRRPDGSLRGFVKVVRDNTERKETREHLETLNRQLEARVAERMRQIEALSAELVVAEQRERHRIASILHDDLQQVLFGMSLQLESVRLSAASLGYTQVLESITEVAAVAQNAMHVARSLAVDLVPPALMAEDTVAVLRWLAAQMKDAHGIDVEVKASGRSHLPGEHSRILLFQITRELLFNVVKHAGVQSARITVAGRTDGLTLTIADTGKGFDASTLTQRAPPQGLGLSSISHRLRMLGGDMHIASSPGGGTRVTIRIPADTPPLP